MAVEADISAAVRMAGFMLQQQVKEGRWEKLITSPNTLEFVLEAIQLNTNPIIIEIGEEGETQTEAMVKLSIDFAPTADEFDEAFDPYGDTT